MEKKRLFWKHPYLLLLPACCIAPIMVTEVKFDLKKNKTKKKTNSSLAVVSKSCQRFDDCDPTAQDTHILHIHPSTHSKHRHGSRTGMPSIVFPKPCQHVSPHTLVTLRHKSKANTGSISDKCLYVK